MLRVDHGRTRSVPTARSFLDQKLVVLQFTQKGQTPLGRGQLAPHQQVLVGDRSLEILKADLSARPPGDHLAAAACSRRSGPRRCSRGRRSWAAWIRRNRRRGGRNSAAGIRRGAGAGGTRTQTQDEACDARAPTPARARRHPCSTRPPSNPGPDPSHEHAPIFVCEPPNAPYSAPISDRLAPGGIAAASYVTTSKTHGA